MQVRLRQKGSIRSLTYKRGNRRAREEREIRLSAEQFDALWPATAGRRLTKVRYEVPWREHTIEIDIYRGRHDGLVVAEVEFRMKPAAMLSSHQIGWAKTSAGSHATATSRLRTTEPRET